MISIRIWRFLLYVWLPNPRNVYILRIKMNQRIITVKCFASSLSSIIKKCILCWISWLDCHGSRVFDRNHVLVLKHCSVGGYDDFPVLFVSIDASFSISFIYDCWFVVWNKLGNRTRINRWVIVDKTWFRNQVRNIVRCILELSISTRHLKQRRKVIVSPLNSNLFSTWLFLIHHRRHVPLFFMKLRLVLQFINHFEFRFFQQECFINKRLAFVYFIWFLSNLLLLFFNKMQNVVCLKAKIISYFLCFGNVHR